ncbi:hypothetical protein [Mycoplasma sp. 4423]
MKIGVKSTIAIIVSTFALLFLLWSLAFGSLRSTTSPSVFLNSS